MTAQLPLPLPRARRRDRIPSHAAAAKAARFQASHCGRLLTALLALHETTHEPWCPPTTEDVAQRAGLTVVQADRRALELELGGWIFRTDDGLRSLCWWPTEKARTWFLERSIP